MLPVNHCSTRGSARNALPFSAGFGAALVYHRMAQDNEVIASHSGGISHRALLVPAAVCALFLGGSLSALNEWVIPRFLHSMERMITLDVAQMMIRQIGRGQSAELGDVMIHADRIDEVPAPADSWEASRSHPPGSVAWTNFEKVI